MKAIRIYTKDSKYYMEDLDNNTSCELNNPRFDKKSQKHWFDLPENCIGQKAICKEMIDEKVEVVKQERAKSLSTAGTPRTKAPKVDLNGYYSDEEKAKLEKLQAQIDKINEAAMARAQKDIKMAELESELKKIDPEMLKAMMAKLMGAEA